MVMQHRLYPWQLPAQEKIQKIKGYIPNPTFGFGPMYLVWS